MIKQDYKASASTNLNIRVYKQLFVFVVDGKSVGMNTESFAAQLLFNLARNLPKRPKIEVPESWKFQAWVFEDYEEFCVDFTSYKKVTIFNQSYTKEILSSVTCDARIFFEKLLQAAHYYLERAEKNPCLISSNFKNINLHSLKESVAWIKLYFENHYSLVKQGINISLNLQEQIINEKEEQELLKTIDSNPWMTVLRRRVQHYGYRYDYKARKIDDSMKIGELPIWLQSLVTNLSEKLARNLNFDQVIINEYLPGQGIAAHVDCVTCFENEILSLTLNSGCNMVFTNIKTNEKITKYLTPRTLLVLKGNFRYEWKHEIKAVKSDLVNDVKIPRGRRVSITFRTIKK